MGKKKKVKQDYNRLSREKSPASVVRHFTHHVQTHYFQILRGWDVRKQWKKYIILYNNNNNNNLWSSVICRYSRLMCNWSSWTKVMIVIAQSHLFIFSFRSHALLSGCSMQLPLTTVVLILQIIALFNTHML